MIDREHTPTPEDLARYAHDPLAFIEDLTIPGAQGVGRFGDCLAEFQREAFADLIPDLLAVAAGTKPTCGRHWWERTKGGSKDTDLAAALLWLLAFCPRPILIQIGADDQGQADELRKAAKAMLYYNGWLADRVKIQAWRIICEATGAACEILTRDATGSHGARPDVLVINELSHITSREYAETLMDNATKVPNGVVVLATNAGFIGSWQHTWRENARTSARWTFHKLDCPAPWLDAADLEEARKRNSASRYARLFMGVWGSGGGDALESADIDAALTLPGPILQPLPGHVYVGGLDLGLKHDHAALVVLQVKPGSNRVQLAWCQSWKPSATGQVDLMEVEEACLIAHQRYRLAALRYDPHQAALMAQRLGRQGVPMAEVLFVGVNLDLMARAILQAFRSRMIDLYKDLDLLTDLGILSIVERNFGHKLAAPSGDGGHADRAIALAIAIPPVLRLATAPPEASQPTRIILKPAPLGPLPL